MKLQQKSDFLSTRVQYISTTRIRPNPQQPRRSFPEDALAELAESIRCYGILQPLPDGLRQVPPERAGTQRG